MNGLCPHGRLTTAFCEPCADIEVNGIGGATRAAEKILDDYSLLPDPNDWEISKKTKKPAVKNPKKSRQPSGLDAPYYDFPDNIHSAMDLIEWLSLDFTNGNILKSLIREFNPNAKKKSTPLYEAEKRSYYAARHLRRVQEMQE